MSQLKQYLGAGTFLLFLSIPFPHGVMLGLTDADGLVNGVTVADGVGDGSWLKLMVTDGLGELEGLGEGLEVLGLGEGLNEEEKGTEGVSEGCTGALVW